ncbi:hypothetical protein AYK24_02690 [Thermoplasmatales archaeon SG8-52-4]|nr:MAG: hypothetical protein AYK24_02690 [Thermoplasmatales archaeon SG8-52-4]
MKKITRRTFIKLSASGALALGSGNFLLGCGKENSITEPNYSNQINATVAAVKGNNLDSMTRDVIEAIGGMDSIVMEGETVFIKPNFVSFTLAETRECFKNGECTKPEILIATAEECLKAGAKEVIIGDGSQKITYDWKYSYTMDGRTNLVAEAARLSSLYPGNVSLSCLEADYPGDYQIPSRTVHGTLLISNIYKKVDRIISIPVAKTHCWAQLTLALKNFIGVLSIREYGVLINNSYWDRGGGIDHSSVRILSQAFLDVVAAKIPSLTIIDFSIGMEGDGPTTGHGGRTVDVKNRLGSWLILASRDIMAADATAARIMNHPVPNIKQLTMGYEMGLGEIHEEFIEMIGEKLSNIKMNWKAAVLKNTLEKKSAGNSMSEKFECIIH